jgi:hypothetical protein
MAVQEVSGRLFSLFSFVRVPPPELVAYLHRRNYRSPFDFAQGGRSTHDPQDDKAIGARFAPHEQKM